MPIAPELAVRVMMVGLGDIARKAYLPVLGTRDDIELHLVTRNRDVLADLGQRWRISDQHDDLDTALGSARFNAAFVHVATAAHPEIVARILNAGVAVMVDKPLADSHREAARLADLAKAASVPLRVGFNRRYAPNYAALRERPPSLVRMEKHRARLLHPPRRTVFDDFIHVVDTLRFLAPVACDVAGVETVVRDGLLEAVLLVLSGDGFRATGCMHRDSGLDEERVDAFGGGRRTTVRDMADVIASDGAECRTRRGDWMPVAGQRGFAGLCDAFLEEVRAGGVIPADDMLETHRICEMIAAQAERVDA